MKTALFWMITQRVVAISYGCFGKKHIGSNFRGQEAKRKGFLTHELRYNKPAGCSTSVACRGRPWKQTNKQTPE
jgi:hypothetical protein